MKRIILLFGLIFSLVAVKANAGETPTNEQKAHNQAMAMQKMLTLSEDQTVKVEAVLLKKIVGIQTISANGKEAAVQQNEIQGVKDTTDKELAAILTPDQFALYLHKKEEAKTRKDVAH